MAILYKQLHNQQTELTDEYESIIHVSTTAHNNADLFTHGARFRSLWRAPKVYCAKKMTKRFGISKYVRMKKNLNTFTAIVDFSRFNNSCLKSPASTLVDLTFQSRALRSFSLNQLRNLSL